jgi:hypothetical protein
MMNEIGILEQPHPLFSFLDGIVMLIKVQQLKELIFTRSRQTVGTVARWQKDSLRA